MSETFAGSPSFDVQKNWGEIFESGTHETARDARTPVIVPADSAPAPLAIPSAALPARNGSIRDGIVRRRMEAADTFASGQQILLDGGNPADAIRHFDAASSLLADDAPARAEVSMVAMARVSRRATVRRDGVVPVGVTRGLASQARAAIAECGSALDDPYAGRAEIDLHSAATEIALSDGSGWRAAGLALRGLWHSHLSHHEAAQSSANTDINRRLRGLGILAVRSLLPAGSERSRQRMEKAVNLTNGM